MSQHVYGDLSNLNAPYDNVPLRGLGQPFQNPDDPKYPWKQFSQSTIVLQQDLNEGLTSAGGCLLEEDGYLGPKTCGALAHFGQDSAVQTCLNHREVEPYVLPTIPCQGSGPAPGPGPGPGPSEDELVAPVRNQNMGLWLGVGFGVIAIAAAMYFKKKKR